MKRDKIIAILEKTGEFLDSVAETSITNRETGKEYKCDKQVILTIQATLGACLLLLKDRDVQDLNMRQFMTVIMGRYAESMDFYEDFYEEVKEPEAAAKDAVTDWTIVEHE